MGKSLVVVESPAKAKTISKILGTEFVVEASIGHIRDLPKSAKEIPSSFKKKSWATIGIDIENDFSPLYVVSDAKKEHVAALKALLKNADQLYLATDEDREGESIAWHLLEVLSPKIPVKRLVFHEITPKAIKKALENVRDINTNLVQAQEVRRLVDRLYGYQVSPLLWNKLKNRNLSAGRVQSAALRLTVERERERLVFVSADWHSISAILSTSSASFEARLDTWKEKKVANGQSFNDNGELTKKHLVLTKKLCTEIVEAIKDKNALVVDKKTRVFSEKPKAPFITSTLQQEAVRKLRWTAKRTMSVAQKLYENGWITYMRTDSTNLSEQALNAARSLIVANYGQQFLPDKARTYVTSTSGAQEAHEAIRPAGEQFQSLATARKKLVDQEYRLYELIWKRTVASQMKNAMGEKLRATFTIDDAGFVATGKTYTFQGFRLAYVEGYDDERTQKSQSEKVLPNFAVQDVLDLNEVNSSGHSTKPPARYTEASLVKALEQNGIGRPSTYASIIDNITRKNYVFSRGPALIPSFKGMIVTQFLEKYLAWLVDYSFTASMESELDKVAQGNLERLNCLQNFYFGEKGLKNSLNMAEQQIQEGEEGYSLPFQFEEKDLVLSFNRFGEYIRLSENELIYLNDQIAPDELNKEKVATLIEEFRSGPKQLGSDPQTEKTVFLIKGPYGYYVQLGEKDPDAPKSTAPKKASLLKGMNHQDLNLDTALALLSLPKTLGTITIKDKDVDLLACNGRFGPYLKAGSQNASLPKTANILTISFEEAKEIFQNEAKKSGELKEFGEDDNGNKIVLKSGRFGPYVTNGKLNASLGKIDPETIDRDKALLMLEEAKNKPKRSRARKTTKKRAKKTTTRKTKTAKK